ncbi:MAG TPA: hypothetical protein VN181_09230 [Thermoanaerobaculia bacterium]|nr:hypothetical protein [Thermoanaerobaculia bacterium]
MYTNSRIFLAAVFAVALPLSAAALTMRIEADGVTVQDATPGAKVILFGVAREPHLYYSVIRRWTEVLADDDRDGVVRFAASVSNKSIFVVVDLDTGAYVAETGPDYPRREILPGEAFKRNNAGQISKFENARGRAELLVVRRGKGAWRVSAAKNSSLDENKDTPSALKIDASEFLSVSGLASGKLEHLKRDDVVAMIDPNRMEFYLVTVGED